MFAVEGFTEKLLTAGMTHVEVSLYGESPDVHDSIAAVDGAFQQTSLGIQRLASAGVITHLNVPVVQANVETLPEIVARAAQLGARRIQFNFQRPIPTEHGGSPETGTRLDQLKAPLFEALETADTLGVVATTEGIPFCVLGPFQDRASDSWESENPPSVRIHDLHRQTEDISNLKEKYRAPAPRCAPCHRVDRCPITWSTYLELHGDGELEPFRSPR
jgi:MoaA/NifB/PqqE/SkfB family radical SAM enzyme